MAYEGYTMVIAGEEVMCSLLQLVIFLLNDYYFEWPFDQNR